MVAGFGNETQPMIGGDLLITLCDLLGNAIILYRGWVLWNKSYRIIILPFLCAISAVGKEFSFNQRLSLY